MDRIDSTVMTTIRTADADIDPVSPVAFKAPGLGSVFKLRLAILVAEQTFGSKQFTMM